MEDKIQSLPHELRTTHPKNWTTENVCAWLTGWGPGFRISALTQLQNGVDGGVIHEALSDTSQAAMGTVTSLQGPMGVTDGQVLRLKKEMGIFIDICSYFDKKQEPQASSRNTDLLVVSHNDLHTIDCDELASSLTKGGVSGVGLAHALLRTAVPKNSLQQRIQGAPVRVGNEGWLDGSARSSATSKSIKQGITASKTRVAPGSITSFFQKQGILQEIGSATEVMHKLAAHYQKHQTFRAFKYKGWCYKTWSDLLPVVYTPSFSEDVYLCTEQFSHYTALEVPENSSFEKGGRRETEEAHIHNLTDLLSSSTTGQPSSRYSRR